MSIEKRRRPAERSAGNQRPIARQSIEPRKSQRRRTPLQQCNTIMRLIDQVLERKGGNPDVVDFCDGISETVESIAKSIVRFDGSATDGQLVALSNMERGVRRWLR